jgi:hypothetical protein
VTRSLPSGDLVWDPLADPPPSRHRRLSVTLTLLPPSDEDPKTGEKIILWVLIKWTPTEVRVRVRVRARTRVRVGGDSGLRGAHLVPTWQGRKHWKCVARGEPEIETHRCYIGNAAISCTMPVSLQCVST